MDTFLKPFISPETLYIPGGREGTLYSPVESLLIERVRPVSELTIVTETPGTAAPLESWTVPRIVPLTACARSAGADKSRASAMLETAPFSRTIGPPEVQKSLPAYSQSDGGASGLLGPSNPSIVSDSAAIPAEIFICLWK